MPLRFNQKKLLELGKEKSFEFKNSKPFPHVIIDNFLSKREAEKLRRNFPSVTNDIWVTPYRIGNQYGKVGSKNSDKFYCLNDELYFSLLEFNSAPFINFLEALTGIESLLPDPGFNGGGLHKILKGGILDIHTDFNDFKKIKLYRRLNILYYLNKNWEPSWGGQLELWDNSKLKGGKLIKSIPPLFNRIVIFESTKSSFHGHPNPWKSNTCSRNSISSYYYTSYKDKTQTYNGNTDFQGIAFKKIPKNKKPGANYNWRSDFPKEKPHWQVFVLDRIPKKYKKIIYNSKDKLKKIFTRNI